MATHRIPILIDTVTPDTSGKVWKEPYSILATNDVWKHLIWRFDQDGNNNAQLTTRVGINGAFKVPKNYVGSPKIIISWNATVTSGDRVWDFEYRAVAAAESLDQTGTQESVTVTTTTPGTAHNQIESSLTLTAANFAVDDLVEFFLAADGVDAADTIAAATLIHAVQFEYADA